MSNCRLYTCLFVLFTSLPPSVLSFYYSIIACLAVSVLSASLTVSLLSLLSVGIVLLHCDLFTWVLVSFPSMCVVVISLHSPCDRLPPDKSLKIWVGFVNVKDYTVITLLFPLIIFRNPIWLICFVLDISERVFIFGEGNLFTNESDSFL